MTTKRFVLIAAVIVIFICFYMASNALVGSFQILE
jgi:hypothetical protein